MYMRFAAGVFCILYSVLYVWSLMRFSGPTPSKGPPLPSPPPPPTQGQSEFTSSQQGREGRGGGLFLPSGTYIKDSEKAMKNVFIHVFIIGYLQMVNSLCVELEKLPLITF
jgi:hypothetical protein